MNPKEVRLSDEEKMWVKMLSEGKSTKEVAEAAELKEGTFASKLALLRERFDCPNTPSLVALFVKHELIDQVFKGSIYGLVDSTNGLIFYIGLSITPQKRFTMHLASARRGVKTEKDLVIRAIWESGGCVKMEILEEFEGYNIHLFWQRMYYRERHWQEVLSSKEAKHPMITFYKKCVVCGEYFVAGQQNNRRCSTKCKIAPRETTKKTLKKYERRRNITK